MYTLPKAGTGPLPICLSKSGRIRIKPSVSGRNPRLARKGVHAALSAAAVVFAARDTHVKLAAHLYLTPPPVPGGWLQGGARGLGYFNAISQFLLPIARVFEPMKSFVLHLYAEFCSRHLQL